MGPRGGVPAINAGILPIPACKCVPSLPAFIGSLTAVHDPEV